jgi:hypothetical protein
VNRRGSGSSTSAALIATGVVIPLGVEAASLTNFTGYVAWCLWLIAMAVALWRTSQVERDGAVRSGTADQHVAGTGFVDGLR